MSVFMRANNKTVLCLLISALFTSFFFARSVLVREPWIAPTFMGKAPLQNGTAHQLTFANNWLKESPLTLRFSSYHYPKSIDTPTLDKRHFYASHPPGTALPIYLLFKFLDSTGIVPNIYEKRGTQVLLVILLCYLLHFSLTVFLCWMMFFVCKRIGFDNLNCLLLSLVPAIVQFHNAGSFYAYHLAYTNYTVCTMPFVLYIFLEVARTVFLSSPHATRIIQIVQPLIMFFGVLSSWLFCCVALTMYVVRILRKEIKLPVSLPKAVLWVKQSALFFTPALVAISLWIYQIAYYLEDIAHETFKNTAISSHKLTFVDNLMFRTGITDGIDNLLSYYKTSFFTRIVDGYGILGVLMLYTVLYLAVSSYKYLSRDAFLAPTVYLMLLLPNIILTAIFVRNFVDHRHAGILFGAAISSSFVFAPIFILKIIKQNYLISLCSFLNRKSISAAAVISLGSSILYGYSQIYDQQPITKLFSPPEYSYIIVGDFVRKNTEYKDVVFSQNYYTDEFSHIEAHFTNKRIYQANSIDDICQKTREITQEFSVKILYFESDRAIVDELKNILALQNMEIHLIAAQVFNGGLLAFNGNVFNNWCRQVRE